MAAQSGECIELARFVSDTSLDILVTDVFLKEIEVTKTIHSLVSEYLNLKVLVLSGKIDHRYIIDMLSAGASGYLTKSCTAEELFEAIRTVGNGGSYLCAVVSDVLVKNYFHNNSDNHSSSCRYLLTLRERQVLELLVAGYSTKRIAEKCEVSLKTIETHRQHIMRKLNVQSLAELVKLAIREGFTPLE